MGFLNKTKKIEDVPGHLNWMGGRSFDVKDPVARLRMAAASCFFGEPMYYQGGAKPKKSRGGRRGIPLDENSISYLRETLDAVDPQDWRGLAPDALMEKAIDEALDSDPEGALRVAALLRHQDNIRTTPQVILVRAANHQALKGTTLVRTWAEHIINRPDELCVQLAYQISKYGAEAPIPNSLKKAWRNALMSFSDYQLAKYRMESREVKLVDVMNLVHPKRTKAIDALANGKLKTTGQTWEAVRSSGGSWEDALEVMGHMALLRNLRNLLQAGLPEDLFIKKLVDGAEDGRQLPFRYYSAYKAIQGMGSPKTMDALEEAMEKSLSVLPSFPGRVASLCDNSGSARKATTSSLGTMSVASIANLSGVITGKVSDDGHVGVFGDRLEMVPVRKKSSIFDQLKALDAVGNGIGHNTENGIWLFWDQAIKQKEHWDFVFVYSDMQAGHGGLYGTNAGEYRPYMWRGGNHIDVPKLIKEYRAQVNKNVKVFLVQVAGYQDTLVPEFYDKTYILGGWSDGILRFAAEMADLNTPLRAIT